MNTTHNIRDDKDEGLNLFKSGMDTECTDYLGYKQFCKPKLAEMLNSLKLDHSFTKAKGNYLYYNDNSGDEIAVLDFVGGFGANFLGHNNPDIKKTIQACLDSNVPVNVQSAVRPAAQKLAKKLNELLPSDSIYLCHFTNSGAESVEAAIKHAYKVHLDYVRREYEKLTRKLHDLYHYINNNNLEVFLPQGVEELSKFRDNLDEHNLAQYEEFQNSPVMAAFKGSYHGKTTSALKVTFNKSFREGFEGLSAIQSVFIDLDKPERLLEIEKEQQIEFLLPRLDGNTLTLKHFKLSKVFAFIFEIVLGEGGVKPVPEKTLEKLADICKQVQMPFIIDEIQTGCGRTGNIFGYLDTPLANIDPEYIVLSKALGGGVAKIGVAMINEKVYDPDFGFLHTSTFAEDDLSCSVAEKTLELITENNGLLLKQAKEKGDYLQQSLNRLKKKYPQIVKDIRGRGLMIGLEFEDLCVYGPLFRYSGQQGFISLLVTSWLLHHHNIRILAPLTTLFKGNPGKKRESILRIQPPVFITHEEIDRLVNALDECFNIIHHNNEYCLLAHHFDAEISETERKAPQQFPVSYPAPPTQVDFDARIGFLIHVTRRKHLIDFYLSSFKKYEVDYKKLAKWWDKLCRFLEPDMMYRTYIDHEGFIVELNLVSLPYFPKYMIKTMMNARLPVTTNSTHKILLQEMQDKIMDAAIVARDLGDERTPTSLVGLGAFTSIVTSNGTSMNDYEIPITTGNAYTTALMGQGIIKAAEIRQIDISKSKAAVVGAAGNIGSCLTSLLSFFSGKLYLIGSEKHDSVQRMQNVINQSLTAILVEIKKQLDSDNNIDEVKLQGVAGDIFNIHIKPCLKKQSGSKNETAKYIQKLLQSDTIPAESGQWLNELILQENEGDNPWFCITNMSVLKEVDVVAIATNSPDAWLIGPSNVKKNSIICCASVPSNLSETFKGKMDDYFVFDGGFAKLPEGNEIDTIGMPKHGNAYGCLSETLLLAFDGQISSFTKGKLSISQVMKTIELAEMYGFSLGDFKLGDAVHKGNT